MLSSRRIFLLHLVLGLALLLAGCAAKTVQPSGAVDQRVLVDGAYVHYVDAGGGGTPLVLVHGWGGDTSVWRKELPTLSQSRRVLVLDLPGHGLSDKPKRAYTMQYFSRAVLQVMNHAGVEQAVIMGHSMGGGIARYMALRHPERVAGLILVDGALFFLPDTDQEREEWHAQMQTFMKQNEGPEGDAFARTFIDSMHGRTTPQWVKDEVIETILATPQYVRVSSLQHFIDLEVWKGGPVGKPTLAVSAKSDETDDAYKQNMHAMFPSLTLRILDGPGHFFMLSRPRPLLDSISRYFVKTGL